MLLLLRDAILTELCVKGVGGECRNGEDSNCCCESSPGSFVLDVEGLRVGN